MVVQYRSGVSVGWVGRTGVRWLVVWVVDSIGVGWVWSGWWYGSGLVVWEWVWWWYIYGCGLM